MNHFKLFCVVLTLFILVGLCACGEQNQNDESSQINEGDSTQVSSIDLNWQSVTYYESDSEGYEYEYTWTFSPWIDEENSDVTNSYWNDIEDGDDLLPTFSDWDLDYSEPFYSFYDSYAALAFNYKMTNMYYCIGTLTIKNVTDGWSISEESSKGRDIIIAAINKIPSCEIATVQQNDNSNSHYCSALIRFYFSNEEKIYGVPSGLGGFLKHHSAKMEDDKWGPVNFVIMAPEYYSPNTPNGITKELLRENYFKFTDTDMINVGLYE